MPEESDDTASIFSACSTSSRVPLLSGTTRSGAGSTSASGLRREAIEKFHQSEVRSTVQTLSALRTAIAARKKGRAMVPKDALGNCVGGDYYSDLSSADKKEKDADKEISKCSRKAQKQLPNARDKDGSYATLITQLTNKFQESEAGTAPSETREASEAKAKELIELAQAFKP